jgi:Ca2+-binding EF-hand superfamily protein
MTNTSLIKGTARTVTRVTPQQNIPFFEEIVSLIQQAKKVFDAISRDENKTNHGLLFAKDLLRSNEDKETLPDNFTISLENVFRALCKLVSELILIPKLAMIFQSTMPAEDNVERIIEEFDADYSGWTDFPSFLTIVLAIWQISQEFSTEDRINKLLSALPHQLRQARKSFYIADSDEDGYV